MPSKPPNSLLTASSLSNTLLNNLSSLPSASSNFSAYENHSTSRTPSQEHLTPNNHHKHCQQIANAMPGWATDQQCFEALSSALAATAVSSSADVRKVYSRAGINGPDSLPSSPVWSDKLVNYIAHNQLHHLSADAINHSATSSSSLETLANRSSVNQFRSSLSSSGSLYTVSSPPDVALSTITSSSSSSSSLSDKMQQMLMINQFVPAFPQAHINLLIQNQVCTVFFD